MKWEPEQLAVIDAPLSNLAVVACAGSGKTSVVIERIARRIEEGSLVPERTYVITFTVLAADELQRRFEARLKGFKTAARPWTGTIHSFCLFLLKDSDPEFANSVSVLTQGQQFALFYRKFGEWDIAKLAAGSEPGKAKVVERLIRTLDVLALSGTSDESLAEANPLLHGIVVRYREWLRERGQLDFTSILIEFRGRLEDARFRARVKERIQYLVVDEYQDTDEIQEAIFRKIAENSPVMVVGDDDQCIYQFRGTTVTNILEFTSRFVGATALPLSKNFRCGERIVAAAETVVRHIANRPKKRLVAQHSGGIVHALAFASVADEARHLAATIKHLKELGQISHFGQVAILMRSVASHLASYATALTELDVPFRVRGDRGLFDTDEVRRLLAALEVVASESLNDASGYFALRAAGVVPETVDIPPVEDWPTYSDSDWVAHGLTAAEGDRIPRLLLVREKYISGKYGSILNVFHLIVGALDYLERYGEGELRNVGLLSAVIQEYEDVAPVRNLHVLINYLNAYAAKNFDAASYAPDESGAVSITTVHQAKGLEFDYVFCPMLVEARFPLKERAHDLFLDSSLFDSDRFRTRLDDERRLFYVAATRARCGLVLSGARDVGLTNAKQPSLFWRECAALAQNEASLEPPRSEHQELPSALVSSYSRIEYYLSCPYRYFVLFEAGLATPKNPFFEYGKTLHLILHLIHQERLLGRSLDVKDALGLYEKNFPEIKSVPELTVRAMKRRGAEALALYINTRDELIRRTVETELAFTLHVPIGDNMGSLAQIRGQIDLVADVPGGVEVIDFKTGRPHDYIRTDLQLQIYCHAVRVLGFVPKRARILYVEHNEQVSYDATSTWIDSGLEELEHALSGLARGRYHATPGDVCARCELKPICPHKERI